jgi:hypothetical protein
MAFSRATDYILTLLDATLTKEILLMAHQTILGYIPMKAGKLRQIYVHIPNDSGNFIPMHPDHVNYFLNLSLLVILFFRFQKQSTISFDGLMSATN